MLDSFKNSDLRILNKYTPNYIISLPYLNDDSIEINNCICVFYSVIHAPKIEFKRVYFNARFYRKLTKNDLNLKKENKKGFSPNGAFIIKVSESDSEAVIQDIENSNSYFDNFSDFI